MSNITDPFAQSVHGTNPQYLIEKITRLKIYNCVYWKEQCFGLTTATLIDKAVTLKYCGGTYGGNLQPTNFLCLVLKLLQLQPEKEIIFEYINNKDFKYLRALGAFYWRLTGKSDEIYRILEPLYSDYRKLAYRGMSGWMTLHMDEFINKLLCEELMCDVALPHLVKRNKLEELGVLPPRTSLLDKEIEEAENMLQNNTKNIVSPIHSSENVDDNDDDEQPKDEGNDELVISNVKKVTHEDKTIDHPQEKEADSQVNSKVENLKPEEDRMRSDRTDRSDRRSRRRDPSSSSSSRSRSPYYRRRHHSDRYDDDDGRRYSHKRRDDRNSRDGRRDSRDRRDTRYRRDSRERRRYDSRDGRRKRDSRDRRDNYHRREDRSDSPRSRPRRSRRDSSEEKDDISTLKKVDLVQTEGMAPEINRDKMIMNESNELKPIISKDSIVDSKKSEKKKKIIDEKFDQMFGKKSNSDKESKPSTSYSTANTSTSSGNDGKGGKEIVNDKGEKVLITASEGTVEYWNQIRSALGMSKLK